MHEDQQTLCQRILEKCQRQRWYGGDEQNTAPFRKEDRRYEEYIDLQGNLITIDNDPDDHPRKTSFAYAAATEEQLLTTEQALGFPLPPLLRTLYSELANGGFGPGYGLIGALGGFDEAGNLVDMYQYHTRRSQLINLEQHQKSSEGGERIELPDTVWPGSLLYLCDWGDAKVSCLDCTTDKVFLVHMGEKYRTSVLELQAPSLYEWFAHWLEREPEQKPGQVSFSFFDDFDPFQDDEADT